MKWSFNTSWILLSLDVVFSLVYLFTQLSGGTGSCTGGIPVKLWGSSGVSRFLQTPHRGSWRLDQLCNITLGVNVRREFIERFRVCCSDRKEITHWPGWTSACRSALASLACFWWAQSFILLACVLGVLFFSFSFRSSNLHTEDHCCAFSARGVGYVSCRGNGLQG